MLRYIRKHIWSELPVAITPRQRLGAMLLWAGALILWGAWMGWSRQRHGAALGNAPAALAAIGAVLGLLLALPATGAATYLNILRVISIIGFAAGALLLLLAFYLIVTPMGWALRLARKDLLETRKEAPPHWKPHSGRTGRRRYYRIS